ncbi:MAG: hypothetical protein V3T58_07580 [Candidatus Hydrothermarchaeales archaeon]
MTDLLGFGIIRRLANSRLFRPILLLVALAFFEIVILAGIVGTPAGNRNASVVLIWILWFFFLMVLLIPLGGRIWCMVCPITAPAEWLGRLSIVRKSDRIINLGYKWPKRLDNIWLQNLGFLAIATFSPLILTMPDASVVALLLFMFLALTVDLSFKKGRPGKIFCRFVCPLGGFLGLYSNLGVLGIRSKDKGICKKCTLKTCMKGNERGYGCPWLIYPGGMKKNSYCGMCLECIKSCAYNNMTVKTIGGGLLEKRRLDEAFKGFVMLGSVIVYSAAYFGWWAELKELINFSDAVFLSMKLNWSNVFIFAAILSGVSLVVLPGMQLIFAWIAKTVAGDKGTSLNDIFIGYSYSLVPLGFMAWVGFVIGMLMINGSYIVSVVSDPFGWGWNIFGTANYSWRPYFSGLVPYVQLLSFLIGGVLSTQIVWKISVEYFRERALKAALPITIFIGFLTSVFVFLFVMP